jgi:hypothetical protein
MNVALRALSWAIRFFWLITLAFAITCVYSATQISVELGEPTPLLDETSFGATLPIMLRNRGYYTISNLNVTTTIRDTMNRSLSETTSRVAEIPPQHETRILHSISFNMSGILTQTEYLFNDSELTVHGTISLDYAGLIPFGFEADTPMPWGAPLSGFTAGQPEYGAYDAVSQRVRVPISFQNHSPYMSVSGTMRVEVFNSLNQLLGEDTVSIDVPSNTAYSGQVDTLVNAALVTQRGEIHIYFDAEVFDFGPLVIRFG